RCRWGSGLWLMMPPLPTPPTCGPLRDDLPEFLLGLLWKVVPRPGQQQFTPDFVQCENLVELAVGDRGVDVCCHRILDCCAGRVGPRRKPCTALHRMRRTLNRTRCLRCCWFRR